MSVTAGEAWEGKLVFDKPRHKVNFHLPLDWPRINQFPEWFAPEADARYSFRDMATRLVFTQTGKELHDGLTVRPRPGVELRLLITPEQR